MQATTKISMQALQVNYAIFAGNANKLTMIVISLASSIAITMVPMLSAAFTRKNGQEVRYQFSNALILFEFVMLPAALGMAAVAGPLNRTFYGTSNMNFSSNILSFSALQAIPVGLFVVAAALMQGVSQNKKAVKFFCDWNGCETVDAVPIGSLDGSFWNLTINDLGFFAS